MKPLLLSTSDISGGAARAAYRLHTGLRRIGVESQMLVQVKSSDDCSVIGPKSKWEKGWGRLRPMIDAVPLKFYRNHQKIIFSPAWMPDNLKKKVTAINPGLLHLHWVAGGFLRIETLKHFNKPLVWTLHDSWAFTGGCHIPFECKRYRESCGACPLLGSSRKNDLSHRIWKRKHKAWRELDITIVTPSRWLAQCARDSSLFCDYRVEVIPNGLDLNRYKPMDRQVAQELLSFPQDKKLILFGAMSSTSDKNKGFQFLQPALQKLAANGWAEKAELIVFGASEPANPPDLGLKVHYAGYLNDDISLALLYAAADVFVAPSIQDNLPNIVIEALACRTPCVAFDIGGMSDMIKHQKTGYLAQPFETDDLAHGIDWVLQDTNRLKQLSLQARKKAEKDFELSVVSNRYLELYKEVL